MYKNTQILGKRDFCSHIFCRRLSAHFLSTPVSHALLFSDPPFWDRPHYFHGNHLHALWKSPPLTFAALLWRQERFCVPIMVFGLSISPCFRRGEGRLERRRGWGIVLSGQSQSSRLESEAECDGCCTAGPGSRSPGDPATLRRNQQVQERKERKVSIKVRTGAVGKTDACNLMEITE